MLLLPICLVALISCGDIDIRTDSPVVSAQEAEVEPVLFLGADANRGECAANFSRTAPGLCTRTTVLAFIDSFTGAKACTSKDISTLIPANAKTVAIQVDLNVIAQNSAGLFRSGILSFFQPGDATCIGLSYFDQTFGAREQVAMASGLVLTNTRVFIPNIPVNSARVLNYSASTGNNGIGDVSMDLISYTD